MMAVSKRLSCHQPPWCSLPKSRRGSPNNSLSQDIAWMQTTFQVALTRRSAAVMFITQGNPGWDLTDGTRRLALLPR